MKRGQLTGRTRTISATFWGIISAASQEEENPIHRISFWLMAAAFVAALFVLMTSPFLAYRWSRLPFPGFMVEQTLLVSSISGNTWGPGEQGVEPLYRVTHVDGQAVQTADEYTHALAAYTIGSQISFRMVDEDGNVHDYPAVPLTTFPQGDIVRLFWLPYGIGLIYLAIAVWVYRVRGNTRAGRTFVLFCTFAMLVPVLVFDISTSHRWTVLYTLSIALLGGTMVNLAVLFPGEMKPLRRRFWFRVVGYGVSFGLILWGIAVLYSQANPWAYISNWRFSYSYAAVGLLFFYIVLAYRLRTDSNPVVRQQARITLWGGLLAFTPVGIWLIVPQITGVIIPWDPVIFLPLLLIFPISIGVAIVRYHMWDIDFIIRGTLAYTILTVTLALLYFGFVIGLGLLFEGVVGRSQVVVVIATLAIVALANPLRKWLQAIIDRRFYRQKYDAEKTLAQFSDRLRYEVDPERISQDLLNVVEETFQPENVSLWLIPPISKERAADDGAGNASEIADRRTPAGFFRRKMAD